MKVLLTGGAGYIASHTAVELIAAGHDVVAIDTLSNSSDESLRRVAKITGRKVPLYIFDVADRTRLDEFFNVEKPDAVIHFAGLKAVGESVEKPLEYYDNNLSSTFSLLEVMKKHGAQKLIFSSSATVYGDPSELPLTETARVGVGITNPYGQTKFMIEQILTDFAKANPDFAVTILRYFNPVGAHQSGLIGEDPNGIPNNLFPFVSQVAIGKRDKLMVFGDDYDTPDGTCVRDYIHVVDLARGHVAALENLTKNVEIYNLGTGRGESVLDVVNAFSQAIGREIPYEIAPRRAGDIAKNYSDPAKANAKLNWHAEKTLIDACEDSYRWQSQNPNGYQE